VINLTGAGESFLNGAFGDLVERHAADAVVIQAQRFLQVPSNGFPFSVRVGSKVDCPRLGRLLLETGEQFLAVGQVLVGRRPPVFDVDAELRLGQVPNVAFAGGDV